MAGVYGKNAIKHKLFRGNHEAEFDYISATIRHTTDRIFWPLKSGQDERITFMKDELKFKFSFLCGILWKHWFIAHPFDLERGTDCRWCNKKATEKDINDKAKAYEKEYKRISKILNKG